MRFKRLVIAAAIAALPASMLAVPATAQQPDQPPAPPQDRRVEVVAEGLDNPRGIAIAPDGSIYIAEAGRGGDNCSTQESPEGEGETFTACFGLTGKISRIDPQSGNRTVVADGLPSVAEEDGSFASGPADVTIAPDGTVYAVIGLGGNPEESREPWGEDGRLLGHLIRLNDGEVVDVADIANYEVENDPDQNDPSSEGVDTNPYAVYAQTNETVWVADAGGNDLLHVNQEGEIALFAVFPSQMVDAPPFLGMPEGSQIPAQAVPTTIAEDPNGGLYVGELTGFPFPVGKSRVWGFTDGEPTVFDTGVTNVTGLTWRDDSLFAVEIAHYGLLEAEQGGRANGAIVRRRPNGTKQTLLLDTLLFPADAATANNAMIYLTNHGTFPGGGQVLRFDASLARDASIQSACGPDDIAWPTFEDVDGNVHDEAIACLVWRDILSGMSAERFAPADTLVRAQAATLIKGLVEAAGGELPADPEDRFDDDNGSVHEGAINQLAAVGVLSGDAEGNFGPTLRVSRGQFAAMLTRAYEHITGNAMPEGPDRFDDDEDSTHETAINAAANAGWVRGVDENTFNPEGLVSRAAASSMTARSLSTYVDRGEAQ